MNTREAMAARRSIRRFKSTPLPDGALDAILDAATQAPSAHNRQPWRFTVVADAKRQDMVRVLREALAAREAQGENVGSAKQTMTCMQQAPVTVFVHNPGGAHPWLARAENTAWTEIADVQSIGAAIENMLLAAQDLGIGSLWIADVWEAYPQLNAWLETDDLMVAAVSLGYADESPSPRPRRPRGQVARIL